jgi:hypothetical protein
VNSDRPATAATITKAVSSVNTINQVKRMVEVTVDTQVSVSELSSLLVKR